MSAREREAVTDGMDASVRVLRAALVCAALIDDMTEQARGKSEQPAAAFDDPRAMVSPDDDSLLYRQTVEFQHVARRE